MWPGVGVARSAELQWVPHHTDDLDADFRRFYRMSWGRACRRLSSRRLFALCERVAVYGGVVAARARQQQEAPQRPAEPVPLTVAEAAAEMPGLFDVVEVRGA